ncbi:MAG: tail fiber protein [Rhodoferax sp.]
MSQAYLGEIRNFGFNFPPRNWMSCNGQLLAIMNNSALFALLGTTYGGNGTSTFGLPDLRGRVPVGMGSGPGLTTRVQGEMSGSESTTLAVSNLPPHTHALNAKAAVGNQPGPGSNNLAASDQRNSQYSSAAADAPMAASAIGNTGSGAAFTNMPPYLGSNYCICVAGIFPSRN